MNCMVFDGVGSKGGCLSLGAPSMQGIIGLSLARHVHGVMGQVHWRSHCGIVSSCGLEFWLPAFMSV